ncbi:MAG: sugar ABC transporter permease [Rhizobiales bacterium 65-9]|nr:ABC transporter permease [Hyphomicrobiales bacterium]OJY37887.1 MAG: sugar ABC transporter permease [Rhizobiales bacterium 65-9]
MLRLEPRREPSAVMRALSPALAVLLTLIAGFIAFTLMGYNGALAIEQIALAPLLDPVRWPDLLIKAAPLILIATGLSIGFRANVWNIGAEGQYILGAIFATGAALATWEMSGRWILPLMLVAGAAGGAAWAAIPAFLRVRWKVSEILVSLMLTYVSIQLLYYLVRGPWKDPQGFNFPQTRMFSDSQTLPAIIEGSLVHLGVPIAIAVAIIAWILMSRSLFGYSVRLVGMAPQAARHAGFSENRTIWATLLISGALAGFAGALEAAGPFGQLVPQFPANYGFTAIIVAFLGRLDPLGVIAGALLLAVTYVGGELAQTSAGLPQAAAGVFQAMLLFFLLAVDVLARYRIRVGGPAHARAGA